MRTSGAPGGRWTCAAATLLHVSVALFLCAAGLGAWIAAEQPSALRALAWLSTGGAVYVGTLSVSRRRSWWRATALAIVLAGSSVAAYVVLAYGALGYSDKVALVTRIGLATGSWLPGAAFWTPFPNSVATLLEGLLPLAAGIALGRAGRGTRGLSAVSALVIALALLLTASRGAWLAELVVAVIWLLASRGGLRPAWRVGVPAATAAMLAVASVATVAVAASAHPAQASAWLAALDRPDRLVLYGHSLSLARDFAFTGIGLGEQFTRALSDHALLIQVPFLTYSHNLLLDIWLEMGLAGLAAWSALLAAVVVGVISGERAGIGNGFRGAYLGLVAMLVHGLSDARQSVDGWTWLPFFALTALVASRLTRERRQVTLSGLGFWAALPAAVCVAVAAWVWPVQAAWHANAGGLAELAARAARSTGAGGSGETRPPDVDYLEAIRIDPDQRTARRRLGIRALAVGLNADARAHLEVALAADPDNWTTRKALGLACIWTGDVDEATRLLGSLDSADIAGELDTWSWWRESRGELPLALRAAQVAARLGPDAARRQRVRQLMGLIAGGHPGLE